jgi:hypothetical protein
MLALTQMLGAAKVAKLEDPTVWVQQQVLGLDIPKLYHANKTKSLNNYLQYRIVQYDALKQLLLFATQANNASKLGINKTPFHSP